MFPGSKLSPGEIVDFLITKNPDAALNTKIITGEFSTCRKGSRYGKDSEEEGPPKNILQCLDMDNFEMMLNDTFTILSPNFPNSYISNANCGWNFSIPTGYGLRLKLNTFDLEEGYDTLRNPKWNLIVDKSSNGLSIFDNYVTLEFTSDDGVEKKGFNVTLDLIRSENGGAASCTGSFNLTIAANESLFLRSDHDPLLECLWNLETEEGYRIYLIQSEVDIDNSTDVLRIQTNEYFWHDVPEGSNSGLWQSEKNSTVLEFTTGPIWKPPGKKGFNVTLTSGLPKCINNDSFSLATNENLYIISPKFPSVIFESSLCNISIETDFGSHMALTPVSLELGSGDSVTISDDSGLTLNLDATSLAQTQWTTNKIQISFNLLSLKLEKGFYFIVESSNSFYYLMTI